MTVTPSEDDSPGAVPPTARRFPEGVALTVAAVFGAAMVLAALLIGRPLLDRSSSSIAEAAEGPETTVSGDVAPSEREPDLGEESDPKSAPSTTESSPSTTEPSTEPSTAPTTEPDPPLPTASCPDGVDPVICDAAEFVQETRRRTFKTFPSVVLLSDADFDAETRSQLQQFDEDLVADGVVLEALGLLDADDSYAEVVASLTEVGVVGFYDVGSGRLVVRGQEFDLYVQSVLVHELTHALDDQWFELNRELGDGDAQYGFAAVVEGNARRVEQLWVRSLDATDRSRYRQQQALALSPADIELLRSLPPIAQQLQSSPYIDGEFFVADLVGKGGEIAVDDALTGPPPSSEQVLHPGLDRQADPELQVPIPATDEVVELAATGRLGELLIRYWLGRVAGDGWGGDRFVAWRQDGASCLRVDVAADSPEDGEDVLVAAEAWVEQLPDRRSAEPITTEVGELVRITGCS